jgi:SAM-dependent methyltransferase
MSAEQNLYNIQTYEQRNVRFGRPPLHFLTSDVVFQEAMKLLPGYLHPESILDIGCGTGRRIRASAQRWPKATLIGIDNEAGMIAEARSKSPDATFYVGSPQNLPFPDMSLDLITSTMSFHHWEDQAHGVMQVANSLRPGGYFLLADQVPPFGLAAIVRHGHPAGSSKRRKLFAQAGLNIIAEEHAMTGFVLITLGRRALK